MSDQTSRRNRSMRERVDALHDAAVDVLSGMSCGQCPNYPMGCPECMNTGFYVTCEEDDELVGLARATVRLTTTIRATDQPIEDDT